MALFFVCLPPTETRHPFLVVDLGVVVVGGGVNIINKIGILFLPLPQQLSRFFLCFFRRIKVLFALPRLPSPSSLLLLMLLLRMEFFFELPPSPPRPLLRKSAHKPLLRHLPSRRRRRRRRKAQGRRDQLVWRRLAPVLLLLLPPPRSSRKRPWSWPLLLLLLSVLVPEPVLVRILVVPCQARAVIVLIASPCLFLLCSSFSFRCCSGGGRAGLAGFDIAATTVLSISFCCETRALVRVVFKSPLPPLMCVFRSPSPLPLLILLLQVQLLLLLLVLWSALLRVVQPARYVPLL